VAISVRRYGESRPYSIRVSFRLPAISIDFDTARLIITHCRNSCRRRQSIRRIVRQHSSNHHRHCGLCSSSSSSSEHSAHHSAAFVEASSSLRTLLIVVVVVAFDRYIRSTAIFVAYDAYDGYIRSTRLVAISVRFVLHRFALISVSSPSYRYPSIVIADSFRGSGRFVAALYNDGYIHTTAITVIGEYRLPYHRRLIVLFPSSLRTLYIAAYNGYISISKEFDSSATITTTWGGFVYLYYFFCYVSSLRMSLR